MERVGEVVLIAFIVVPLIGPGALSQASRTVSVLRRWPITLPPWRILARRLARWSIRTLPIAAAQAIALCTFLALVTSSRPITLSAVWSVFLGWLTLGFVLVALMWVLGWLLGLLWFAALRVAAVWHSHAQPRHEA